jgi:hypothetical protein
VIHPHKVHFFPPVLGAVIHPQGALSDANQMPKIKHQMPKIKHQNGQTRGNCTSPKVTRRTNWNNKVQHAKLQAAVLKWQRPGGVVGEKGKALSLRSFAITEGISVSVLRRHIQAKEHKVDMAHGAETKQSKSVTANLKGPTHKYRRATLLKKLVGVGAHTVGPSYLRAAGASTVEPRSRFLPIIVGRSPFAASVATWRLRRQNLTQDEFAEVKRKHVNARQCEKRQQYKQQLNWTARGAAAGIESPEGEEASKGIAYEDVLSETTPDSRLAFLPVVDVRKMTNDQLSRLREVEERVVAVLGETTSPHKFAGNQGHSIGLTTVSGGGHATCGKSGSIHLNKHLKQHEELQDQVLEVVGDILLHCYGKTPWFLGLVEKLKSIPDEAFLPGRRKLPVSHIWLTSSPKVAQVHCDSNSFGAVFIFTAKTVDGGELIVDQPVDGGFQVKTYHLTAGKVVGGSWGQYAHCNLPVHDRTVPRRSFVVYLDYRNVSKLYRNLVPRPTAT